MINETAAWAKLSEHKLELEQTTLVDLFNNTENRFDTFSLRCEQLLLDYSKNHLTAETLNLLEQLAQTAKLQEKLMAQFSGEKINCTEDRAVLHTALRAPADEEVMVDGNNVMPKLQENFTKMFMLADEIHQDGVISDVVNIGIGGSDLGPKMVCQALKPYHLGKVNCHFVSNVDGTHLAETIKHLNPEKTLFIVASKTFTTIETLSNAVQAKQWLLSHGIENIDKHFIAITSAVQKANDFGIQRTLAMYDFIGGRYSLWSTIGLSIVLAVGVEHFRTLLAGANAMDQHAKTAPFKENMPMLLGMIGVWYNNFFGATTHAILAYDQYLEYFCDYLQQLDMESNGKRVTLDGESVDYATGPIIWGGLGTNSQHAFHQLLHQGTHTVPVDFIVSAKSHNPLGQQHKILYANCLSQSRALMLGRDADAHKTMPGNHPSNTLVLDSLNPFSLGQLIALYEHKVFVQGVIWGINSFDQWGVELGKQIANQLLPVIQQHSQPDDLDSSTVGLLDLLY